MLTRKQLLDVLCFRSSPRTETSNIQDQHPKTPPGSKPKSVLHMLSMLFLGSISTLALLWLYNNIDELMPVYQAAEQLVVWTGELWNRVSYAPAN